MVFFIQSLNDKTNWTALLVEKTKGREYIWPANWGLNIEQKKHCAKLWYGSVTVLHVRDLLPPGLGQFLTPIPFLKIGYNFQKFRGIG